MAPETGKCGPCRVNEHLKQSCKPTESGRGWPEPCQYCAKKGHPCSPLMSKTEFDKLSEFEKDAFTRTPADIISYLDCLAYLKAEIDDTKKAESLQFDVSSENKGLQEYIQKVLVFASARIDEVTAEITREGLTAVEKLNSEGKPHYAMTLLSLCSSQFGYSDKNIFPDDALHVTRRNLAAISLSVSKSAGLIFRWFKILCLVNREDSSVLNLHAISYNDVHALYQTLKKVVTFCSMGFKVPGPSFVYPNKELVTDNFFEKISPLIHKAVLRKAQTFYEPQIWMRAVLRFNVQDIINYQGDTVLHLAILRNEPENVKAILDAMIACNDKRLYGILTIASLQAHTPLQLAVRMGCHEIVRLLISAFGVLGVDDVLWLVGSAKPRARFDVSTFGNVPLTSFMAAIIFGNEDVINIFRDSGIRWWGPGPTLLSSIIDRPFMMSQPVQDLALRPIYLAGITEQYDLFERIFEVEHHILPVHTMWAVVIVAVYQDRDDLLLFLSEMEISKDEGYCLLPFIEEHASLTVQTVFNDSVMKFAKDHWALRNGREFNHLQLEHIPNILEKPIPTIEDQAQDPPPPDQFPLVIDIEGTDVNLENGSSQEASEILGLALRRRGSSDEIFTTSPQNARNAPASQDPQSRVEGSKISSTEEMLYFGSVSFYKQSLTGSASGAGIVTQDDMEVDNPRRNAD